MIQENFSKILGSKFKSAADNFDAAIEYLEKCQSSDLRFGIRYLDLAFRKIFPDDLIVIASPTGRGKTELVTQIANNAVKAGKRFYYFVLESHKLEIELRLLYKIAAGFYFEDTGKVVQHLSYLDWKSGKCDLRKYYPAAKEEFTKLYGPLMIYYKEERFGCLEFMQQFNMICSECDMWAIDHAQYIDVGERENEYRAQSEAMMKIKSTSEIAGKAGIIVSHIRKHNGPKATKALVPDYEDLMGSSNIPKVGTRVFTFAPIKNDVVDFFGNSPTAFRICKDRNDGDASRFIGVMGFDIASRCYGTKVVLCRLTNGDTELELVEEKDKPQWFKEMDGDTRVLQDV